MWPARSTPRDDAPQFVGAVKPAVMPAESDVEEDYARFYRKAYDAAMSHALYFLDLDVAKDVVQDAAFELFRKWAKVPLDRKRPPDLLVAAVHMGVRRVRKRRRREDRRSVEWSDELEEELVETGMLELPDPALVHEGMEDVELVHRAIAALPPRCRQALLLHRDTELSYAEIAAMLDLKVNTVTNHITRAHRLLREYFERSGLLLSGGSVRRLLGPGDSTLGSTEEGR